MYMCLTACCPAAGWLYPTEVRVASVQTACTNRHCSAIRAAELARAHEQHSCHRLCMLTLLLHLQVNPLETRSTGLAVASCMNLLFRCAAAPLVHGAQRLPFARSLWQAPVAVNRS